MSYNLVVSNTKGRRWRGNSVLDALGKFHVPLNFPAEAKRTHFIRSLLSRIIIKGKVFIALMLNVQQAKPTKKKKKKKKFDINRAIRKS